METILEKWILLRVKALCRKEVFCIKREEAKVEQAEAKVEQAEASFVQKGILSVKEAAAEMGVSEEIFLKWIE